MADLHRRLRRPDERDPEGRVLEDAENATWAGTSIARGELADEIATLREQPGGEIVAWGGGDFAQSLSRAGLIDEYVLVIKPGSTEAVGGLCPIGKEE